LGARHRVALSVALACRLERIVTKRCRHRVPSDAAVNGERAVKSRMAWAVTFGMPAALQNLCTHLRGQSRQCSRRTEGSSRIVPSTFRPGRGAGSQAPGGFAGRPRSLSPGSRATAPHRRDRERRGSPPPSTSSHEQAHHRGDRARFPTIGELDCLRLPSTSLVDPKLLFAVFALRHALHVVQRISHDPLLVQRALRVPGKMGATTRRRRACRSLGFPSGSARDRESRRLSRRER